ncbi:hypothetical protein [Candidatus Contubernalis alkaliaceticus]|uniref:hypothetical protein n=1 Tax=Candidatus Contubernalis alkaliaceticus TaxID=338645 RepID=UPI001F4C3588|nr:hypothetical protein [Candidatus Contubernalis alkalaceticus]UNC92016.1 hypothetical protein HUE98_07840 [Candidatus Contubernalis alkalaceticus]
MNIIFLNSAGQVKEIYETGLGSLPLVILSSPEKKQDYPKMSFDDSKKVNHFRTRKPNALSVTLRRGLAQKELTEYICSY